MIDAPLERLLDYGALGIVLVAALIAIVVLHREQRSASAFHAVQIERIIERWEAREDERKEADQAYRQALSNRWSQQIETMQRAQQEHESRSSAEHTAILSTLNAITSTLAIFADRAQRG